MLLNIQKNLINTILKYSQDKSHYNALGHVAHKLVRVIFTVIKKDISYWEEKLE
ncbi:hypothetical protein HMPREF0397_1263 [Fusobacterium nucleatum subsp. nucleatum ATCC 23726]|uniref:Uncharacterized protein n=1 Tax=Fusobacterium nucleatum subsp. nucleatum (strain ATCC 23726 / VPI 4351) TaxID=525283 RepID=D5RDH8_FUSN2|nr:hypothetical protein HMPREF0397_1263 [Fusobacterium nucleatum subsp. nucleatum ATCC 23726]